MLGIICRRDAVEIIFQTACCFSILDSSPLESIVRLSIPFSACGSSIQIGGLHTVKQSYYSSYLISVNRCHIKAHIKSFLIFGQFKKLFIVGLWAACNTVPLRSLFIQFIPSGKLLGTMAGDNNTFLICNLNITSGSVLHSFQDIFQRT